MDDKFDKLNRETTECNRKNFSRHGRFNPSTRANYPTSYNPNGYYSPDRSRDVDRFNPSTKANYSYYNPYGNR